MQNLKAAFIFSMVIVTFFICNFSNQNVLELQSPTCSTLLRHCAAINKAF